MTDEPNDEITFDDAALTGEGAERAPRDFTVGRLIGCAGSGKSYQLNERVTADPNYGLLTATTGIAAMNLGNAVTLNSKLGYFDTASMHHAYDSGQLTRACHKIAQTYRNLIVEEYSMMEYQQLDLLYHAVEKANQYADVETPMGILLVGDLAQLPPVGERGSRTIPWCFKAMHWPKFAANTEKLTKVWRQNAGPFLDALNALREGRGGDAADALESTGITWHSFNDMDFAGTTILPVNSEVEAYNTSRLVKHAGRPFEVTARRWGAQRPEWNMNQRTKVWGVPPQSMYKIGAQVMILANQTPEFTYVNGDGGIIREIYPSSGAVDIELFRNGRVVTVSRVVRDVERDSLPDHIADGDVPERTIDDEDYYPNVHFRRRPRRRYIMGQIEYLPIRLGYATSVHKSQSLTLDRVQIEFTHKFFGAPAMLYVALSRCRTSEGLRLRGSKDHFIRQCNISTEVLPWL